MQVCLFLTGAIGAAAPLDFPALQREARETDGLRHLVAHAPIAGTVDPRIAAGPQAPSCVLQWYFDDLTTLEAALEADGAIARALRNAR
jgi:hypothetical protein